MFLRGNYYGDYEIQDSRNPANIQAFGSLVQVDANLTWDLSDGRYSVTLGGNNVFDKQTDQAKYGHCCGAVVRRDSVMDWQGPYYYLRGVFRWD